MQDELATRSGSEDGRKIPPPSSADPATGEAPIGLIGRHHECRALDLLVADARAGRSQVLVLRGEAGVGKTALLSYVHTRASGCRTATSAGVESEMELAFAGLHRLCAPMLDGLPHLPGPQADALGTAFGLRAGEPPDPFLVGLAVLSLLSRVAEESPLVCLIDDAQWLDGASARALAFVARRLAAESIVMLITVREPADDSPFPALPEMVVRGLDPSDARALLSTVISGPVDERVRDRIIADTHGNPLALLELPRDLTPAELAGGFGLPATTSLVSRLEQSFLRQLSSLPAATRRLVLTAAAEPLGDALLLWRAVERLGIGPDAAGPAIAAGLIEVGTDVRFRHPLVRTAARRAADPAELRAVHRALAEVTDPVLDADRRAWHRAHATLGPDEAVAAVLEGSADRAQARGGVAAAAAFLERASELTPDPTRRGVRALAAAQALFAAGAREPALGLLAAAERSPLDALQRAQVTRLRARVTLAQLGASSALPSLLDAAAQLAPLDADLARETYLDALGAAIFAGRLGGVGDLERISRAAGAAPTGPAAFHSVFDAKDRTHAGHQKRTIDLMLEALAARFTDGYVVGAPPLRRALHAFSREPGRREEDVRWSWLAWLVATEVWDDESCHQLSIRAVRYAREAGALTVLPVALLNRATVHLHLGELAAATEAVEEAMAIDAATGRTPVVFPSTAYRGMLLIASWRGEETRAVELVEASIRDGTASGHGRTVGLAETAAAVLYNGLGRYEEAFGAAQRACADEDLGFANWALTELVEAATRSGYPEVAAAALRRLAERTRAGATDWALGIEARSRALLSEGRAAESLYVEAIQRLSRTRIRVALARAHLVYGEWLRREGRRVDARGQLRTAHQLCSEMRLEGFAERARRELLATGETVRKRTVDTADDLTAQEAQIARLASAGRTNSEIGAELFISPRTVEWHLSKVFPKLGITSRRELRRALST